MSRLLRTLLPLALLLAAAGARAGPALRVPLLPLVLGQSSEPFVRAQPPEAAPHCLFWTRSTLEWSLDAQGSPDTPGETEFDAIRSSFAAWQALFAECGNLTLQEGPVVDVRTTGFDPDRDDNRNVVLFRTRSCSAQVSPADPCWAELSCGNTHDCWDHGEQTIAITLNTSDARSGILRDSDIELNAAPHADGARFVFSASPTPGCGSVPPAQCLPTDVQNTVTHEVGHLLGLDHTQASGSTMNPDAAPGDTSKRTVDPGSADFVCTTYPRGLPSQDCVALPAGPSLGRAGASCAAVASGPGSAWALLLLAAAARRRR